MKQTARFAFLQSLPVMAGYVVLGIGFGILLSSEGYSFLWAFFMSLTIYAGSMQYVGVNLLASGASLLSAGLMTLLVNARHLFYGISMIKKYKDTGAAKPYLIFGLTDETYSLVCTSENLPQEINTKWYYLLVTLFDQFYWILGSVIGGLLGDHLNFNSAGIEFSMTALFLIIFIEQWEKAESHLPAITGLVTAVVCLLVFGAEHFLIPTMIGILVILTLLRPVLEPAERRESND